MGFTRRATILVPPRENLGGSYSMLNSIDVRPFVIPSVRPPGMVIISVALPSYSHLIGGSLPRWVLAALGGNLVPPKFTSGGSYPMLNSIDVRNSVIPQNWDMLVFCAKVRLLTAIR